MDRLTGQELSENNFVRYTTADGLTDNMITDITQDSTGYIWIATSFGLNRYNGREFIQFHSTSDSLSLPAESISAMTWLNKNQLAIYPSGVHIINTKTDERHNIFIPYHNQQYQYKFNLIMGTAGDEKGNVYILSRSGFYHYDNHYKLVSRFDFYKDEEVPYEHFFAGERLLSLDSKRLLIIARHKLYVYEKEKRKLKEMTANDCPLMAEFLTRPAYSFFFFQQKPGKLFILKAQSDTLVYVNTIQNKKTVSKLPFSPIVSEFAWRSRLLPISDTVFYITGHSSGFYKMRFYPETGSVKFYPEKYFSSYLCQSVLKDKDNRLWIATNKGLFRQDPGRSQVDVSFLPLAIQDSFPNVRLDDIHVSANKIYVASMGEGGLFVFDKKTFQLEKQILFDSVDKRNNIITSIASTGPSTLLLGTYHLPFLFDEVNQKIKRIIPPNWDVGADWTNDLFNDEEGNVWIGSDNIYKYNTKAQSFTLIPPYRKLLEMPNGIEEDRNGHIWMSGHGLARYNTDLDSFDMSIDSFPFIKMLDKQINSFVIDRQNIVWFNARNNGLCGYDINRRHFLHFTTSAGLPNNNISSMTIIGNKLWMAGVVGVACMDLRNFKIVSFGKEDGFPDMGVVTRNARFFYDSTAQQLYLSFSNAIVRFNPFEILQKKSPPKLFVENLTINGEKNIFLPGQNITTSWRDNEIMITIGTINFLDGNNQGFAYRILSANHEVPWQQLGKQSSFSISNLSPGTYRIQVKVFSLSNRWPEQIKEMSFVVLPPFWKKNWFRIPLAVIAIVLIYLLIRWRIEMAREKEMEKTHIEKLKADDYKNQFELEQITNYFSSSLAAKQTEGEVLWDVTNNLMGRMDYVDCMIYLWNEDKTKMVQKAAFGPKGKPEFISNQVFDVLPGQGIVGYVIETRQPLLVNDTRNDSRYRVDDEFRLSEVAVPIIHNDELLGVLDSEHHLPNYFSERDIKILTTIATLIGNRLTQIKSEKSLEAKHKELATINEQLAEARLKALQSQMNPHFVFNALNSIKRMILDRNNEKASRYLSKFALMIRMTLNHSRDTFVTLDENIEYLKAYLEMEQLRFDDSFTYSIFTGENIDVCETSFPSLMIQPLVENAIWHGLLPAETDKRITIRFTQSHNKITCIIEDNGIGIRQSEKMKEANNSFHRSVGLENLRGRIKIMNEKYDTECSLNISDLKEIDENRRGTRVILQFKMINT
ncbi:MAG TPA: histidine kinase [Chitinophagaceae bacterium]|nr:histidine kinase [Chitinophagaceae bacterium]